MSEHVEIDFGLGDNHERLLITLPRNSVVLNKKGVTDLIATLATMRTKMSPSDPSHQAPSDLIEGALQGWGTPEPQTPLTVRFALQH